MPSICSGATNKETPPAPRMSEELARGQTGLKRSKKFVTSGKIHTISMRDGSLDPKRLANERKNYEMYMREAIALARRVTDPALRDRSVGHIIDLCIDGGEEGQATVLLSLIQSDFVRREIAGKHPQLAVRQSRQSLAPEASA